MTIYLVFVDNSYAHQSSETCGDVGFVFARGSGSDLNSTEAKAFRERLVARFKDSAKLHFYELGTEAYGGAQYPAVNIVNIFNGNAIGAYFSGGESNDYGRSVAEGRTELELYLKARTANCPNERIVLAGLSQGAQLIADDSSRLYSQFGKKIEFIALFGDPKLYLPEGEGILPDACWNRNLSVYRQGKIECHTNSGILGARKPYYVVAGLQAKTGLWCREKDPICGASHNLLVDKDNHNKYAESGGAIDQAAQKIAIKIKAWLEKNKPNDTSGSPIDYNKLIDTNYAINQGTAGKNIVFLIDGHDANRSNFTAIRKSITKTANHVVAEGGNFALGLYCMQSEPGYYGPSYRSIDFSASTKEKLSDQSFDWLSEGCNVPMTTPMNGALYVVTPNFSWRQNATKSAIIFTNQPEPLTSGPWYVNDNMVYNMMLKIDPVNVFPIVPEGSGAAYQALADNTSGSVTTYSDNDIETAAEIATQKLMDRPVALLKLDEYIANPGQSITFDASDSYANDSSIVHYEWDFDGDGVFDQTTATPTTNHIYTEIGDGIMQVRVVAANGLVANASATLKIGTYVPPVRPAAPRNLTAQVIATHNGMSTAKLSWQAGDTVANTFMIRLNDVPLGITEAGRTSTTMTDIDRTQDAVISVSAVTEDGLESDWTSVTIAKQQNMGDSNTPLNTQIYQSSLPDDSSRATDTPTSEVITMGQENTTKNMSTAHESPQKIAGITVGTGVVVVSILLLLGAALFFLRRYQHSQSR